MSSKKGSKAAVSKGNFDIGDIVLAKMSGFPPWPAKVVAPTGLRKDVLRAKPPKGQYHLVRFYTEANFSWCKPNDLTHLDQDKIDAYLNSDNKKKDGKLQRSYETARDPAEWEASLQGPDDEDEEDELEEDVPAATGSKRKAGGSDKKETKKPKVEKKPKSIKKITKTKSSVAVESEEESEKKPAPKATEDVDAGSAKVRDWRHKLQRAFLGKGPPKEEDMPANDEVFTTIENYDSMTVEQLQTSKIGKVMRKIIALPEIPREADFNFKERAQKLISKWQAQLNAAGSTEDGPAPAANGAAAFEKKEGSSAPAPTEETTKSGADGEEEKGAPDTEAAVPVAVELEKSKPEVADATMETAAVSNAEPQIEHAANAGGVYQQ